MKAEQRHYILWIWYLKTYPGETSQSQRYVLQFLTAKEKAFECGYHILFFLTESPNPLWNCCKGIICVDIYDLQKEIPNTLIFKWITFCLRKKSASVLLHYRNLHQSVRLFSSALHVSLSSLASKSSGLIYLSHTILVRLVSFISSVWFQ